MSDINYYRADDKLIFFSFLTLSWSYKISFTYFLYFYLIPKYFFKKKHVLFILYSICLLIVSICITSGIWNEVDFFDYVLSPREEHKVPLILVIVSAYFLSFMLVFLTQWVNTYLQKNTLEKEVKNTEYLFLKSQMSPHFLFNTLNNIYSLSIKNNSNTSKAIKSLKGLMEYVKIYESNTKIKLIDEISYLEDFISLNNLRYAVPVNFETNINNHNLLLEPMLLLPFIENTFKHGNTSEKGLINISLIEKNNTITFLCKNTISHQKSKDSISGIGLKNVRQRLNLLYPDTAHLNITENQTTFQIQLSF